MSKHTPGPWEVRNLTDVFTQLGAQCRDGRAADSNDGWHVADCRAGKTFVNGQEVDLRAAEEYANARLIAAAPDLLAAAFYAEKVIDILWVSHHANRSDAALEQLRTAIAKATMP